MCSASTQYQFYAINRPGQNATNFAVMFHIYYLMWLYIVINIVLFRKVDACNNCLGCWTNTLSEKRRRSFRVAGGVRSPYNLGCFIGKPNTSNCSKFILIVVAVVPPPTKPKSNNKTPPTNIDPKYLCLYLCNPPNFGLLTANDEWNKFHIPIKLLFYALSFAASASHLKITFQTLKCNFHFL